MEGQGGKLAGEQRGNDLVRLITPTWLDRAWEALDASDDLCTQKCKTRQQQG